MKGRGTDHLTLETHRLHSNQFNHLQKPTLKSYTSSPLLCHTYTLSATQTKGCWQFESRGYFPSFSPSIKDSAFHQ